MTIPNNPDVTIVTIFFNQERFLEETIASVQAQTVSSWELLLVDDGSTDGSLDIAREATCDARIRVVQHEGGRNRGMSASRNLGVHHAKASLIAFLDGDDVWEPDKLECQIGHAKRYPEAVMLCGASLYWRSWEGGEDEFVHVGDHPLLGPAGNVLPQDQLVDTNTLLNSLHPLGRGTTPSMSGTMVRTEVLRSVGGFEERFTGMFEDQVFRAKMYLAGPTYVSSKVLDRYRRHDASCTATTNRESSELIRSDYLEWLSKYLRRMGTLDFELRARLAVARLKRKHPRCANLLVRALPAIRLVDRL